MVHIDSCESKRMSLNSSPASAPITEARASELSICTRACRRGDVEKLLTHGTKLVTHAAVHRGRTRKYHRRTRKHHGHALPHTQPPTTTLFPSTTPPYLHGPAPLGIDPEQAAPPVLIQDVSRNIGALPPRTRRLRGRQRVQRARCRVPARSEVGAVSPGG